MRVLRGREGGLLVLGTVRSECLSDRVPAVNVVRGALRQAAHRELTKQGFWLGATARVRLALPREDGQRYRHGIRGVRVVGRKAFDSPTEAPPTA